MPPFWPPTYKVYTVPSENAVGGLGQPAPAAKSKNGNITENSKKEEAQAGFLFSYFPSLLPVPFQ